MKSNEGFAKLKGYDIEYFMQKLAITLGRTPSKTTSRSKSKKPSVSSVDIPLGDYKNISRKHAKISYNFKTGDFELTCYGKNGVKVDGTFYGPGSSPIRLIHGSEVQLGDAFFVFLLPTPKSGMRKNRSYGTSITPKDSITTIEEEQALQSGVKKTKKKGKQTRYHYDENTKTVYEKPPYSYATMIAQALSSQQNKRLTLQEIYSWIMEQYPFFQSQDVGWKSSVRHNLSLNKFFHKVPADETEHGKRAVYELNPEFEEELLSGVKGGRRFNKNLTSKESKERKRKPAVQSKSQPPQKKVKLESSTVQQTPPAIPYQPQMQYHTVQLGPQLRVINPQQQQIPSQIMQSGVMNQLSLLNQLQSFRTTSATTTTSVKPTTTTTTSVKPENTQQPIQQAIQQAIQQQPQQSIQKIQPLNNTPSNTSIQ